MKQANRIIALAAVFAVSTFAAGSLQAQVANVITFTATASVQSNTSDNGTVTTTAAPTKVTLDTKQILAFLATAENEEGNYGSTTFPTGAKLVTLGGTGSPPDFQVVSKTGALLVDVADIITVTDSGTYGSDISSGKSKDSTGLASTTETDQEIITVAYDDTGAGGSLQFVLTGLFTDKTTDTAPSNAGTYRETQSHTLTDAAGDGNYRGNPLVISGGFSASGSATLTLSD